MNLNDLIYSFKIENTNNKSSANLVFESDDISFKINKGETIAVVGKNGAGKTTFVKLLLRFYDCDSGEILYNGINIKEFCDKVIAWGAVPIGNNL